MAVTLRYLGWSAFEVTIEDGRRLLLDPLLAGLPDQGIAPSPVKLEEFDGVELVLVTHVARDYLGQAFDILGRSRAQLVCNVATQFLAQATGIAPERIFHMVPGVQFAFGGFGGEMAGGEGGRPNHSRFDEGGGSGASGSGPDG